jgi:hypothetical protein
VQQGERGLGKGCCLLEWRRIGNPCSDAVRTGALYIRSFVPGGLTRMHGINPEGR